MPGKAPFCRIVHISWHICCLWLAFGSINEKIREWNRLSQINSGWITGRTNKLPGNLVLWNTQPCRSFITGKSQASCITGNSTACMMGRAFWLYDSDLQLKNNNQKAICRALLISTRQTNKIKWWKTFRKWFLQHVNIFYFAITIIWQNINKVLIFKTYKYPPFRPIVNGDYAFRRNRSYTSLYITLLLS